MKWVDVRAYLDAVDEMEHELDALRARVEVLTAALQAHGFHGNACELFKCVCGLDAALADTKVSP